MRRGFFLPLILMTVMTNAQGPLPTIWAKDVNPDAPRPEYPRPRMERKDWQSLNGHWDFAFVDADGKESGATKIVVPFPYEAALSGVGSDKGVHDRVVYRREFDIPASWKGKRLRLNFGAVDWEAKVFVNGKPVGEHRGGYAPFSFDVTDALKPQGPNALEVKVYDPIDPKGDGIQPKGKQLGSHSIWYTRTTGIWLPVWIEPVGEVYLENLEAIGDMEGVLTITPTLHGEGDIEAVLTRKGQPVASGANVEQIRIPNPALWSPEEPNLYDLKVTVKKNGKLVDEVTSYVAFRTAGMADGRLTLNGKLYFYRGVLDQGYWPDGNYTPPTDEAVKHDVEVTKALGFNMARKHVKVDDPRWYYWCDKLGLAVWQDMPSSHANLSENKRGQEIYRHEWTEVVEYLRDQPSILHWIPFNEDWGHPEAFQDEMVAYTRQLDPTRPITDASGWTQRDKTDIWDAHDYSNDPAKHVRERRDGRPQVVGEYGGVALPVEGHTWSQGWGYQSAKNPEDLLRFIRRQTAPFFGETYGSGYVYTQLTDVEQELNGLLTYDRLPKAPLERFKAIFEGKDKPVVVGRLSGWRVSEKVATGLLPADTSSNDENKALIGKALESFGDDAKALQGEGFVRNAEGDEIDFQKLFGGQTDGAVVYAMRTIEVDTDTTADLLIASDDAVQVWLDGKPVHKYVGIRGLDGGLDTVPVTLTKGSHTLLVKVAQGKGGWGVSVRLEK
ncbi:glycoside hydrolase family 2 TIM barrel-domain containing protein [soil metagenome]